MSTQAAAAGPQAGGGGISFKSLLKRADLLQPVVEEEAKLRTNRGGLLFLFACAVCLVLAYHSVTTYLSPANVVYVERMEVDGEMAVKLPVELDITFFHLSCLDVELVVLDVAGEAQINIDAKALHKIRIDANGGRLGETIPGQVNRQLANKSSTTTTTTAKPTLPILQQQVSSNCASCYGAEEFSGDCCPTCSDIKSRYQRRGWDVTKIQREAEQCLRELDHPEIAVTRGEGCILQGTILVNKVAGNIHVALGVTEKQGDQVVHTFSQDQLDQYDTSHHIAQLRFGLPLLSKIPPYDALPGGVLDGQTTMVDLELGKTAAMQYHLHLVPSRQVGQPTSYRYSLAMKKYLPVLEPTKHATGKKPRRASKRFSLPGVYFMYDFSPFVVVRDTVRVPFIDVVADLLTLCGGTFALVSVLDKLLSCIV